MPAPSLAIDFGTSRTKVAYFDADRGEPRLVEIGREIRNIVPSIFYVPAGHGDRQVGDDAQEMIDTDSAGVIVGLKKEIHRLGKKHFGPGRPSVGRVDLASDMFQMIRRVCREQVFHSDVTHCTLTVPSVFEEQKRECIRRAAELGGFREIRLVEEPIAAAQAWLVQMNQKFGNHVIVCDVGGGTTDLALLRYVGGRFEQVPEIPTAGLPMGGSDVDESIFDQLLDLQGIDFEHNLIACQKAGFLIKLRTLRELMPRDLRQEFRAAVGSTAMSVPRDVVEQCTSEFVVRVQDEVRRFLARCNPIGDTGNIPLLLVGGTSRLSGLKESLETLTPGHVFLWNQSDYATVLGAVEQPAVEVKPKTVKIDPAKPESPAVRRYTPHRILEMVGDGQCEQAFEIVARALATKPNDEVFALWLQVSATVPDGLRVLSRARDIHHARHEGVWATAALANALIDVNRRDEAKTLLTPWFPAADGACFAVQMTLLSLLSNDKSNPDYQRLLDHLLETKPKSPLLLAYRGSDLCETNPTHASELFEQALRIDPCCIIALLGRAMVRLRTATDQAGAVGAIRPDLNVMERVAKDHCGTRMLRAWYRFNTSDFHGTKSEIDTVIQDPRLVGSPNGIADILMLRARANLALNDPRSAGRDVDEVLRFAPDHVEAVFLRAELLHQDNNHWEAFFGYEHGLRLAPGAVEGLVGRGRSQLALGRFSEASLDFESAAMLRPENVEIVGLATYGIILKNLDRAKAHVKDLSGYLFVHPNIPPEKITIATSKLGQPPSGDSAILLLYDATSFNDFDEGFYLTERNVVTKRLAEVRAQSLRFDEVWKVYCEADKAGVWVDGQYGKMLLAMPDGYLWEGKQMRAELRRLMKSLVELHQRLRAAEINLNSSTTTSQGPDGSDAVNGGL